MKNAPSLYPPNPAWIAAHLRSSDLFFRLSSAKLAQERVPFIGLGVPQFAPIPALAELRIPQLRAPGDLAEWLDVTMQQLDWLADKKSQHGRTAIPVLQHYSFAFFQKRHGSPRLIEAPKPRLRAIQQRILHEILDLVPPHQSAHGFVRGRSCLTGAQIHAGERIVVALDLQNFFTSILPARVHAIFRCLGYPWAVAQLLTGLCTTVTPVSIFTLGPEGEAFNWQARKMHSIPHLPQGAATSPALANLSAWHLDKRLAGLARRFGANYTRYADDLAFSGDDDLARKLEPFQGLVAAVVREEGFVLNTNKTRVMDHSKRQCITGLVVNEHVNVPRKTYDELKAILHNCVGYGPREQNRRSTPDFRAHLDGRVSWIEAVNPHRGAKLRRIFNSIRW
jgi:retron-type reverse transcriptase